MMKTLLLLRHAKSDWNDQAASDHDRALASRGKKAARRVGALLRDADLVPDLVVSSTATRARDTAERAVKAGEWGVPLELRRELYLCPPRVVLDVASEIDDAVERLLIVGHEPTLSGAIELLTGARVGFVTAALAAIELPTTRWRELGATSGRLAFLIPPRLLEVGG